MSNFDKEHNHSRLRDIINMEEHKAELTLASFRNILAVIWILCDIFIYFGNNINESYRIYKENIVIDACYLAFSFSLFFFLRKSKKNYALVPFATITVDLLFITFASYLYSRVSTSTDMIVGVLGTTIFIYQTLCALRLNVFTTIFSSVVCTLCIVFYGMLVKSDIEFYSTFAVFAAFLGAITVFISVRHQQIVQHVVQRSKFERFLPRHVTDQVIKNKSDLELGGSERQVTVLFTDIKGFTSLCEKMKPLEIMGLLNDYFTAVSAIIFKHEGTLDKYIGDAVMAVFGAPNNSYDDGTRATRCAMEITTVVEKFNLERASLNQPQLTCGIGLHTGRVVAGFLGSPDRMEYTVIGDTVNVAARVEGLTRKYNANIVITEATKNMLGPEFICESLGDIQVKGREGALSIYKVVV